MGRMIPPEPQMPDVPEMVRELYEALRPFAAHVGKGGSVVTLTIGNDTWTHSLKTDDFERASKEVRKASDYLRAIPNHPDQPPTVGGVDREAILDLMGRLRDDAASSKARWADCKKIGDKHGMVVASQIADDCDEAAFILDKCAAALTARPSAPAEVGAEAFAKELCNAAGVWPGKEGIAAMAALLSRHTPAPVEPGSEREARPTISESRLLVNLAKEAKDWRHNAYSRVTFAQLHDALASALASVARPAADGAK